MSSETDPASAGSSTIPPVIPNGAERYRSALRRVPSPSLAAALQSLGSFEKTSRPTELATAVFERLEETRFVEGLIARLSPASRMALGLIAITENPVWPVSGLSLTMACLGADAKAALPELLALGLLVQAREGEPQTDLIIAHPTVLTAARTILPENLTPPSCEAVRQVRQSDGLEPILRLAALWQRVEDCALRRTQQGTLYKKDRERIEDDPVLAGPITDSLEPLPDSANLWLALARSSGLVIDEAGSDRTIAASADYWAENAVHLPQMLASRWLGLRSWHEAGGLQGGEAPVSLSTPFIRVAVMLWLATIEPERWLALEDLASHLDTVFPGWSAPLLDVGSPTIEQLRGRIGAEARVKSTPRRRGTDSPIEAAPGVELLATILVGPAYQLGLVRAAEEDPSGRRVVQLTDLGRYSLAIGRPPTPRETFVHFLFVQPNFEVIAYRQGLNPSLIGALSRFMIWTQSGAALEMKLTPESVYRGLEGGLTTEAMMERLARHSARPLPAGVAEALKTWSSRRDRVTYYSTATLIEFAAPEALEDALVSWTREDRPPPQRVSERVLLVEEESAIPFSAFRMAGSRDYTKPPEICVEVENDGVTLSLDLARSDLFIDAELGKFADTLPDDGRVGLKRRYRVSPESLQRAVSVGLNPTFLSRWFSQRAGAEVPPALRLLLHAAASRPEPFTVATRFVLTAPSKDLLDGLTQHPATRDLIGDRLGPSAAEVPAENVEPLRKALGRFGLTL